MPFGDATLHVLSAEDLMIFKVLFDREKDWRDLDELVFAMADELDAAYVRSRSRPDRILAPDDARRRRAEDVLART